MESVRDEERSDQEGKRVQVRLNVRVFRVARVE
jgi:hypothetical protein